MFVTTPDQARVLHVLEQTGCLTVKQAYRLLRASNPDTREVYARRLLNQLQYMQLARAKTGDIFVPPHLFGKPVDADMLSAVDVMLDLACGSLLDLSARTSPFKLCFLTGHGEDLTGYGIVTVQEGEELRVNSLLEGLPADDPRTVIFLLDSLRQTLFKTTLPHYFVVRDNGKYRYFKGG